MKSFKFLALLGFLTLVMRTQANDVEGNNAVSRCPNDCRISVKMMSSNSSLLLDASDHKKLIYPSSEDGNINIQDNFKIFASCLGKGNHLKTLPTSLIGKQFSCSCSELISNGKSYDFSTLDCESRPTYHVIDNGNGHFSIAFRVDNRNAILRFIEIRHDARSMSTLYAKSTISKAIGWRQVQATNRRFDQSNFANDHKMDDIYDKYAQFSTFSRLFRDPKRYFDEMSGFVFAPAQLAPKSSFVYTAQGVGTFVYLNTAPQWASIQDGNWQNIEDHVNLMADKLNADLEVYTGVLGQLSLPDPDNEKRLKDIYLHVTESEKAFPVPLYFWKIVYEPIGKKGVVYVTVNNPHLNVDELSKYHICQRPITKHDEMKMPNLWNPKVAQGYSYACKVDDFIDRNLDVPVRNLPRAMDLLYIQK